MKMLEDRANGEGLLCLSDDELRSVKRNSSISDVYDVEDTVFARGKFATVRRANHKTTGVQYAAKYIKKRRRAVDMTPEIYHEISVLRKCAPCGRVVRLHEVYETNSDVVLVLELAAGGELQRIFDTDHCLNEVEARRAMRQILEGLGYLHERNIAHLDLKPQNLLLTVEDSCDDIKLCDFGVSRLLAPGAEVRALLGTPDYVAPEVLSYEPISLATDIWSVGVLAYVLLSGFTPFGGDSKQETYLNISQCILTFEPDHFGDVSTAAIDFIKSSLLVNPRLRPSVQELLKHPWISPKNHILPSLSIKTTEPKDTTPKTTPISQHLNNDEEASSSNLTDNLMIVDSNTELIETADQPIIEEILSNSKSFDAPPNSLAFHEEHHDSFPPPQVYISPEFEFVEEFTRPISNLETLDVSNNLQNVVTLTNGNVDIDDVVNENVDTENNDEDNEIKISTESIIIEEETLEIEISLQKDEHNEQNNEINDKVFEITDGLTSIDIQDIEEKKNQELLDGNQFNNSSTLIISNVTSNDEEEPPKIETNEIIEENNQQIDEDNIDKSFERKNFLLSVGCSGFNYKLEEVTNDLVNEEIVAQEIVNEGIVKEEIVNVEIIKEEIVNEEIVNERIVQEEIVNEEIVNVEIIKGEIVNEEIVNEGIVKEEIVNEEIVNEGIVNEEVVNEVTVKEEIVNVGIIKEEIVDEKIVNEEIFNSEIIQKHFDEKIIVENTLNTTENNNHPSSSNLDENGDLPSQNNRNVDENANLKTKIESEEIMTTNFINLTPCSSKSNTTEEITTNHINDAEDVNELLTSKENLDLGFDEDSFETDEEEGRFAQDSYLWEHNQPSKSFGSALSKFKAIEEQTQRNHKARKVVRRKTIANITSHIELTSDLELSPDFVAQGNNNLSG